MFKKILKSLLVVATLTLITNCASVSTSYTLTDDLYGQNNLWFIKFEPIENKSVRVFVDGSEILDGIDKAPHYGYVAIYDLNKKLSGKEVTITIK